jgi:hypothetical protein
MLMKNSRGRVVTKKSHAMGKKAYKLISAWTEACQKARKEPRSVVSACCD